MSLVSRWITTLQVTWHLVEISFNSQGSLSSDRWAKNNEVLWFGWKMSTFNWINQFLAYQSCQMKDSFVFFLEVIDKCSSNSFELRNHRQRICGLVVQDLFVWWMCTHNFAHPTPKTVVLCMWHPSHCVSMSHPDLTDWIHSPQKERTKGGDNWWVRRVVQSFWADHPPWHWLCIRIVCGAIGGSNGGGERMPMRVECAESVLIRPDLGSSSSTPSKAGAIQRVPSPLLRMMESSRSIRWRRKHAKWRYTAGESRHGQNLEHILVCKLGRSDRSTPADFSPLNLEWMVENLGYWNGWLVLNFPHFKFGINHHRQVDLARRIAFMEMLPLKKSGRNADFFLKEE